MSRELSTWEIAQMLSRHPVEAARIAAFEALVAMFGYDQILAAPNPGTVDLTYPGWIPPSGIGIVDSQFGNVLVAPDARGTLHYSANVPALGDTNKPQYQSPTGNTFNDFLAGIQGGLKKAWVLVLILIVGFIALPYVLPKAQ